MASTSMSDEDNQKRLDREIRDMVSTLTHRLTHLQSSSKHGSTDHTHVDDDEHGVRVITLAGTNTGATMRADLRDKSDGRGALPDEQEMFGTYANSNYQALNNSIMMNGKYTAEDPGIHIEISDYVEEHGHGKHKGKMHGSDSVEEKGHEKEGHGKHKEKKKESKEEPSEKTGDGEE